MTFAVRLAFPDLRLKVFLCSVFINPGVPNSVKLTTHDEEGGCKMQVVVLVSLLCLRAEADVDVICVI